MAFINNGESGASVRGKLNDPSAMRGAIGATTAGSAMLLLANPGAITFVRINADNSADTLSASAFRTAIGLGSLATQSGTFSGTSSGTNTGDQTITSTDSSVTGAATATLSTSLAALTWNVCSGTSANYTLSLPAVSGNANKFAAIRMDIGLTKLVTVDGNGSETIDGALTRVMWAQETAILLCDGSTWTKIAGRTVPMIAVGAPSGNGTATNNANTKIPIATSILDPTGRMVNTTSTRLDVIRGGNYVLSTLFRIVNATAALARIAGGAWKNTNPWFVLGEQSVASGSNATVDCKTPVSLVAGDYLELYCTIVGGPADQTYAGDGTTQMSWMALEELPSW